ncbi:MAG: N-6 DNA methylase [Nanoarchaeota archaeon]
MNRKEILRWYEKEFDKLSREISDKRELSYSDFLRIRNFKLQNSTREPEENIKIITKKAFKLAEEDKIVESISELLKLHGVAIPIASTILAMRYPNKYCIIDRIVISQLNKQSWLKDYLSNPEIYKEYLLLMRNGAKENWLSLEADVKGDAYEGLLEKNASDTKGGAGQYFTPRPLINMIVEVMRPQPGMKIHDPACGTGGFLLSAYNYIVKNNKLDRDQKEELKHKTFSGNEIVAMAARLCVMNLYLHGINGEENPISLDDSLKKNPGAIYDIILTNPPFGKASSETIITEEGNTAKQDLVIVRDDFWAKTSNKQLNFLQHIRSILKINGKAAVVLPDNVLFEGGAGETIRKKLMETCDLHTILRLPTGLFYAQGVKANILFFDKKPASKEACTSKIWIYDLRTNMHFTLKESTLKLENLEDFIKCYNAENRHKRKETDKFKCFDYSEIIRRDKTNLDIFWLKDDSLDDLDKLPEPKVIAKELVEDLEDALEQLKEINEDFEVKNEK